MRSLMPHFLGIGAMRSGTSWLYEHLSRHPRVRMARKEIHFFDQKLRPGPASPFGDAVDRLRYAARFVRGPASGGLRGEITPAYAILDEQAVRRVHDWMPDVRLIYLLRDPVDRAWSHARFHFARAGADPIEKVPQHTVSAFLDSEDVRLRSDYARCLSNWLAYYPSAQLFVGFYEDLLRDPSGLLKAVTDFLQLEDTDFGHRVADPVHEAPSAEMPEWVRAQLAETFSGQSEAVSALLGREVPWT